MGYRVIVGESLQAFAFSWGQTADGETSLLMVACYQRLGVMSGQCGAHIPLNQGTFPAAGFPAANLQGDRLIFTG